MPRTVSGIWARFVEARQSPREVVSVMPLFDTLNLMTLGAFRDG